MFCLCFCIPEVISSLKSWITGICAPYVVSLYDCHTMWSGKSLPLLCILPFGMLCLCAISMMFVKILLIVCMLVGMVVGAKIQNIYMYDTDTITLYYYWFIVRLPIGLDFLFITLLLPEC